MENKYELDEIHLDNISSDELIIEKLQGIIRNDISTDLPTKECARWILGCIKSYRELYYKLRPLVIIEVE